MPSKKRPAASAPPAAETVDKFPNKKNIAKAVKALEKKLTRSTIPSVGQECMYKIEDIFIGPFGSWQRKMQPEGFEFSIPNGILYRPAITEELFDKVKAALEKHVKKGVLVQGPHGIGKSHSLVNLVLKLQSTGNYLVTFVPDCDQWDTVTFVFKLICDSLGITLHEIGFPDITLDTDPLSRFHLEAVIEAVSGELAKQKKQWVFVFDQINKVFDKDGHHADNMSQLRFPFSMIKNVLERGLITSVISASANNEIANNHAAFFDAYIHTMEMTESELLQVFGPDIDLDDIKATAGGNPYYVRKYLNGRKGFLDELKNDVNLAMNKLREGRAWHMTLEAIVRCLFQRPIDTLLGYDMKYLVVKEENSTRRYLPVFPAVLGAYRHCLWLDILAYVAENEAMLLRVCADTSTTNATRGRIFEHLVLQRIKARGLTFTWNNETISIGPNDISTFIGHHLPSLESVHHTSANIPDSPGFPAIDFFVRRRNTLVGFQCHVSADHDRVASTFLKKCLSAGWLGGEINEVGLIYLSPGRRTQEAVQSWIGSESYTHQYQRNNEQRFAVISATTESHLDFDWLSDLAWPLE
jgi:hypothetical protein